MKKSQKNVYITKAYDGSRIYAKESDVKNVCNEECGDWEWCRGEDIKGGSGCLVAFIELCTKNIKFIYEEK